jgi:hypothetical protein
MLRYEASIRELFYRSCTADRSFVPQDDRKVGYAMLRNEVSISELFWCQSMLVSRSFLRQDDKSLLFCSSLH